MNQSCLHLTKGQKQRKKFSQKILEIRFQCTADDVNKYKIIQVFNNTYFLAEASCEINQYTPIRPKFVL